MKAMQNIVPKSGVQNVDPSDEERLARWKPRGDCTPKPILPVLKMITSRPVASQPKCNRDCTEVWSTNSDPNVCSRDYVAMPIFEEQRKRCKVEHVPDDPVVQPSAYSQFFEEKAAVALQAQKFVAEENGADRKLWPAGALRLD